MKRSGFARVLSVFLLFGFLCASFAFASDPEPVAPPRNAAGVYEISKAEHLLFLGKNWAKKEAPREGHYVLTNDIDMSGITGFIPIGKDKENSLLGIFDGQNHAISNLTIDKAGKKYVALFGYCGNDFVAASIRNLALLNIKVTGNQNVGSFAGVSYGTIENCFATGTLIDDLGSNAQTVGGIVGKNKEGESVVGLIKNCYAFVDISGSFNLGGIAGQEDGGGIIENCYAAGTIVSKNPNGAVGGIVGAFNAGQAVRNNVSLISSLTGEKDTDKIIGQLADESGTQITGNLAWDAARLIGNEPVEQPVVWKDKSAAELAAKATWLGLGWDFDTVWAWKGDANSGYPVLKAFPEAVQNYSFDQSISVAVVSTPVKKAPAGKDVEIVARVISSSIPDAVELWYGTAADGNTFSSRVPMKPVSGDSWSASIPAVLKGNVYYYIKAIAGGQTVTKPWNVKNSIMTFIDDGTIYGMPAEVVISLGEVQSSMGINWMTVPAIADSVVRYAKKEGFSGTWVSAAGTSSIVAVTPGFKERMSHKTTLTNLEPATDYIYKVGDGAVFMSPQYAFTSPPAAADMKEFTFLFTSDPQSVSKKDYETLAFVYNYALTQVPKPAFTMMGGDITQDGYKSSQWQAFFESIPEKLASIPFMPSMGNHDFKGDPRYLTFNSRFNTPANGPGGDLGNTVYCFEYGDAFFATLNTEAPTFGAVAPSLKKQLDWLEIQLSRTTKKWKILQFHEGPYTSNHDPTYIRSLLVDRLDAMNIDLVLSGHDHLYLRTSMIGDRKVMPGEGTTYVTGGTVGNKFYEYVENSRRWTEVKADELDRQIVSFITVSRDRITVKAMQRVDPKSKEFKLLDSFQIDKTVLQGKKPLPLTFLRLKPAFIGGKEAA